MAIKKIRVSNFKSFKDLEIELGNFNVLIGANASGKSNFIQIFKFLRDIVESGLDNAIALQGGTKYLRNMNVGSSRCLTFEVVYDQRIGWSPPKTNIEIKTYEIIYRFGLEFRKKGPGFKISEDNLVLKCEFVELGTKLDGKHREPVEGRRLGQADISFSNESGTVRANINVPDEIPLRKEDILKVISFKLPLPYQKTLLLATSFYQYLPLYFIPSFKAARSFYSTLSPLGGISIYDFDPKLPKKAVSITGKAQLEEDGSNLAIVLGNIIESRDKKRKFSNLMGQVLPFVENLDIDKFEDKSLFLKIREKYW